MIKTDPLMTAVTVYLNMAKICQRTKFTLKQRYFSEIAEYGWSSGKGRRRILCKEKLNP